MNISEHNREFHDSDKATVKESSIGFFVCAINAPMCLASLLGNAAVLRAIWKTPSLHLPEHILLASLALTDFAVGLVVQPLFICLRLASYAGWQAFYQAILTVYPFTVWYLCGVSFLTVTAITVDRFLALKLHLRYHVAVTHARASLVVALIWTVNGCISSMRLWNRKAFYLTVAATTLLCLSGSFAAYWRIFRVVRRHQALIHCQVSVNERGKHHRIISQLKKSIWNTFYVYCIFFLCYTPHVSFTVVSFVMERWWLSIIGDFTSTVVFLNSTINPLLYCWRAREIRNAVKHVFSRLHCKLQDCNSN